MILPKAISGYQIKAAGSLLLILLVAHTAFPQKKGSDGQRPKASASASKGNAYCSNDTLYCSGAPAGTVRVTERSASGVTERAVMGLGTGQTLMIIRTTEVTDAGRTANYFRFQFPGVNMSCDVKASEGEKDPCALICRNGLLNVFGLDTMRTEIFVTLNGKYKRNAGTSGQDHSDADKSLVPVRNFKAPVLVSEDKLAQDTVLIGSFKEKTVDGPNGKLRQISIYNSVGALICTATGEDKKGTPWGLLTYKDSRFHNHVIKERNILTELITLLIREGYM